MMQDEIDARDRRWAAALLLIGMDREEVARLLCRTVEFIDGAA